MPNKLKFNINVRSLVEWAVAAGIALAVYFLLQTFVMKTVQVSGASMEPTFVHGDRAITALWAYRAAGPDYGDIIAFDYRMDPDQKFIKRVVGMSGDVVDMVPFGEGWRFTLNGEPIADAFSNEPTQAAGDAVFPVTVPEGCYFVLGDNRNASKDSRYASVGCVPKDDIMGKVSLRIWPPKRVGFVE